MTHIMTLLCRRTGKGATSIANPTASLKLSADSPQGSCCTVLSFNIFSQNNYNLHANQINDFSKTREKKRDRD